jgi:hypothetical protein
MDETEGFGKQRVRSLPVIARAWDMTMRFYAAGRTDVGKLRSRNEDTIQVRNDAGLWVVADGLGGHTAGDYASQAIVERLSRVQRGDDAAELAVASKRFWRRSMPICRKLPLSVASTSLHRSSYC